MTALSLVLLLGVTGCKTSSVPFAGAALDSLNGQFDATEQRLSTAAANAEEAGNTEEALGLYEQLYAHNNYRNQSVGVAYAQLLRKSGKTERALEVLAPFMETRRGLARTDIDPVVLNEYAAVQIELGHFLKAEPLLNQVLEDKNAAKYHAEAFNLLGVLLDAQGQHKEAEASFRQALESWKGDPTSVMNNLGLCLASQGMFDESLMTLRQALLMAPHKQEIAHNIQMVTDIRKTIVRSAPVDIKK